MALLSLAACSDDPTGNGGQVAQVQVTAAAPTVERGDSVLLSAAPRLADGTVRTDLTVSWFSTDTSVARVEGRAGQKAMVVGKKAGTVTIRAMAGDKTGQTALEVTVTEPAEMPVIAAIAPATATEGDTLTTITVTGANFSEMSLVKWNGVAIATEFVSSTVLRALITPANLAQAGTAEVTVRTGPPGGGTSTGKPFTILSRVATVNVRVSQAILWVGEELQVEATPRDQGGNDLPKRSTTWTTSDATVLAVDNQGVIRPLREGYAEVRATVDGKVGSEGVYVKTPPIYDLMYDSNRGGPRELWIISLGIDATPRRWLPEGFWGEDAATNHNGTKIAFVSRDQFLNTDIWVANRDGSGLTRLTTYAGADDQPVWSPDGSKIAFRSMRSGQSHIWIMNADGSDQRNLMTDGVNVLDAQQSSPTFGPNGRVYFQNSYPHYGYSKLASLPVTGGWMQLRDHTPEGFSDTDPAVSWNGDRILVRRKQGSIDYGLVYVDLNGTQFVSVYYPGPGFTPAWARNDQWIAYSSSLNGLNAVDIYVAHPYDFWRKRITVGDAIGGGKNPVFVKR